MTRIFTVILLLSVFFKVNAQELRSSAGLLKYVIYDFDGLDLGQTNLPDGDYLNNDMSISVSANPLTPSDVLGDRVLKMNLNWQAGVGEFGKATMRFLQMNASQDKLNFFFYNPSSNSGPAEMKIIIAEDDNDNNIYEDGSDDKWEYSLSIQRSGAWQFISVPLSSFQDGNTGGNGVFDAGYTGNGGMLFSVSFRFTKPVSTASNDEYFIDMICFSDGDLPSGATPLELPAPATQGCALGALTNIGNPDGTPAEVHAFLPAGNRIKFVNWFVFYSTTQASPDMITGDEVQNLINDGYTPVITWEMMYNSYPRLDPLQPRLDKILNGSFDSYIDQFAAKIKSYSGEVILRIFHEFEGDWYSWSISENGNNATVVRDAFRYVVDRFRSAGANNVKWMWCLNAEPKPYVRHNWVVDAYPGDSYVDIVATDIYNHPDTGTPDWKSFRFTMAESYYYLAKYYSHKPLYVCEVGCRERYATEPVSSQTKADWLCMMNKDLRSYFPKTEALIFFSMNKEHDWRINSGQAALNAFISCFWNNNHYAQTVALNNYKKDHAFSSYPNPFSERLILTWEGATDTGHNYEVRLLDVNGRVLIEKSSRVRPSGLKIENSLPTGVYILEMKHGMSVSRQKLLRTDT
jgi:hypothetical protein